MVNIPTQSPAPAASGDAAHKASAADHKQQRRAMLKDGTLMYAGSFLGVGALAIKNAVDRIWNNFYKDMRDAGAYSVLDTKESPWRDYGPVGVRKAAHKLIYGIENQHLTGAQLFDKLKTLGEKQKLSDALEPIAIAKDEWFGNVDRVLTGEERRVLHGKAEALYSARVDEINKALGVRGSLVGGTWDRYKHTRKSFTGKTVAFQVVASTGIIAAGLGVLKQNLSLREMLADKLDHNKDDVSR